MGLMFVKYFKTYFKYSKHVHPQTKEREGTYQAEFPELGSGASICSHLDSCDLTAQEWKGQDLFPVAFPSRLWEAGFIFNCLPTFSSLMAGMCLILIGSLGVVLLVVE